MAAVDFVWSSRDRDTALCTYLFSTDAGMEIWNGQAEISFAAPVNVCLCPYAKDCSDSGPRKQQASGLPDDVTCLHVHACSVLPHALIANVLFVMPVVLQVAAELSTDGSIPACPVHTAGPTAPTWTSLHLLAGQKDKAWSVTRLLPVHGYG